MQFEYRINTAWNKRTINTIMDTLMYKLVINHMKCTCHNTGTTRGTTVSCFKRGLAPKLNCTINVNRLAIVGQIDLVYKYVTVVIYSYIKVNTELDFRINIHFLRTVVFIYDGIKLLLWTNVMTKWPSESDLSRLGINIDRR